ncbi:hypothetical protein V6N13_108486 [Hibiscus sabdariffa]|uniref:DDE Tnp4 domain-containing protein n=1 Tax=Hibiscus sabdariffa TaxID=183260 RepID=A0ABR2SSB4_9ROSI
MNISQNSLIKSLPVVEETVDRLCILQICRRRRRRCCYCYRFPSAIISFNFISRNHPLHHLLQTPLFSVASFLMESSDDEKDGIYGNFMPKELGHNLALNGMKFVDEVLNGQSDRCLENFRMDKSVFYKLCDILQGRGLLRHTNRIKIEEQLAIFLFIIGHNLRTRAVQELFRYSGETISRHFNNVLNAIMTISLEFFQPPGSDVPLEISQDHRFYPYFKDCVGAVDGIHVPVMVGVDEQGPFRNKDGLLSQNVLAACSFDLKFHYVLAGWEGSASDLRVLNSALSRRNKLQVPEGRYYLVDNKYANMPGFIAPYLGVPYNSDEFPGGYHLQDAKELLINDTSCCEMLLIVKLVVATCALHNYIRREKPDDMLFQMYEPETALQIQESLAPLEVEQAMMHVDTHDLEVAFEAEHPEHSSQLRDSIATEMWEDYIRDLAAM